MNGAQVQRLADGRLHLHHGPIDIIAQAWGDPSAVAMGEARMIARFRTILDELCSELPALRAEDEPLNGAVARAMSAAVAPFRPAFVTPMAAVAGAVADALIVELAVPGVTRAYVNDGGDIALHLTPGQTLTCAIAAHRGLPDRITIRHDDPVRGIATSGRGGRSWSFGIADAVTVLARTAAMADAAATMIGNAVDVPGHPAVTRRPACQMQADSDLGQRHVTVAVGPLSDRDVALALNAGLERAESFRRAGLIESAALFLHPEVRVLGHLMLMEPADA